MSSELTIGDYWRILRRRTAFILIPALFVALGAWVYAETLDKIFVTTAEIEIQKNLVREGVGVQRAFVSPFERGTMERVTSSREVGFLAAELLQAEKGQIYGSVAIDELARQISSSVSVNNLSNSNILQIRSQGTDPVRIADYANAYATAAIQYHDRERRNNIEELREFLSEQLIVYRRKIEEINSDIEQLRESEFSPAAMGVQNRASGQNRVEQLSDQISSFREQREEIGNEISHLQALLAANQWRALAAEIGASRFVSQANAIAQDQNRLDALLRQYTENYPEVILLREKIDITTTSLLEDLRPAVLLRVAALNDRLQMIDRAIRDSEMERSAVLAAIGSLSEHARQEQGLNRELSIATQVYDMFQKRLDQIKLSESVPGDKLVPVNRAGVPTVPVAPDKPMIIVVGLVLGLLTGLALAFVSESVDTSLTAMKDVESAVGKPILSVIPRINIPAEKLRSDDIPTENKSLYRNFPMIVDARSPASEAYRTLRAVLKNRFFDAGNKSLLVTSTTPQEGKTTTVINLSVACATAGLSTIIVGANMRHPVLGKYFPIDRTRGLNEILTGIYSAEECVQKTQVDNLSIIDSGSFSRRPAELLSGSQFDDLMAWLKERYDVVLVDSPPALPVADAATMASKVDGILLVYLVSVSPRDALIRCRQTLEEVGGNIVGVAFNDLWGASRLDYAGYYYHYQYAGDEVARL